MEEIGVVIVYYIFVGVVFDFSRSSTTVTSCLHIVSLPLDKVLILSHFIEIIVYHKIQHNASIQIPSNSPQFLSLYLITGG